ncbi:TRAP transporter small permease [Spongorhabdus nitratireducens]
MSLSSLENTTRIHSGFISKSEILIDFILRSLMILAAISLASLMFAQVIMRYMLDSPFAGIEEVTILFGVWIYFLGMGYASKQKEHITGGIVSLLISDPFKLYLIKLGRSAICIVATIIFGYFACKYAFFVIEKGRSSIYLQWPKGLWSGSMILGFLMMTGYFLIDTVREYRTLKNLKTPALEQSK